jgi:hypothetical protein
MGGGGESLFWDCMQVCDDLGKAERSPQVGNGGQGQHSWWAVHGGCHRMCSWVAATMPQAERSWMGNQLLLSMAQAAAMHPCRDPAHLLLSVKYACSTLLHAPLVSW